MAKDIAARVDVAIQALADTCPYDENGCNSQREYARQTLEAVREFLVTTPLTRDEIDEMFEREWGAAMSEEDGA